MTIPVGQRLMGLVKTSLAPHTFTQGVQLVFVGKIFQEDKVKIDTSILRSSKLTLFSASRRHRSGVTATVAGKAFRYPC